MFSKILWGVAVGSVIALVWVGYKRGAFDSSGEKMRAGMDRMREGLEVARNRASEGLHKVRNRASEGYEMLRHSAKEKAMQAQNRAEYEMES